LDLLRSMITLHAFTNRVPDYNDHSHHCRLLRHQGQDCRDADRAKGGKDEEADAAHDDDDAAVDNDDDDDAGKKAFTLFEVNYKGWLFV
jgi:hypothetical protein